MSAAAHVGHGRKTVTTAGTPVQVTEASCQSIAVQALQSNTGVIAVGGDNTVRAAVGSTQTGFVLSAGASVSIDVDDTADVWIDSTVNGEGVTYVFTAA